MDAFEYLNSVLLEIASTASQCAAYDGWSDEFARKECREVWADSEVALRRQRGRRVTIDELLAVQVEKLHILGFRNWDKTLILIPLWAKNYIDQNSVVTDIMGKKGVLHSVDTDVRGGCIAHGFKRAA